MKAHLIDTHLFVPRSRSSTKVKVKYQGHVSQKMGVSGALVYHKRILFCSITVTSRFVLLRLRFFPFNPFPDNKIVDLSKFKQIADDI